MLNVSCLESYNIIILYRRLNVGNSERAATQPNTVQWYWITDAAIRIFTDKYKITATTPTMRVMHWHVDPHAVGAREQWCDLLDYQSERRERDASTRSADLDSNFLRTRGHDIIIQHNVIIYLRCDDRSRSSAAEWKYLWTYFYIIL